MNGLPADWFLLMLRLLFVFLLYFFLYQLFKVQVRELLSVSAGPAAADPAMSTAHPRLVVASDDLGNLSPGASFDLQPVSTVGRHPDCVVYVDDPSTSAFHAEIRMSEGQWWIADHGSTNGTFVNGVAVNQPMHLHEGDVVQFGRVHTEFVG